MNPIMREQHRFDCTASDMQAWSNDSHRLFEGSEVRVFEDPLLVTPQFPPCIGCGGGVRASMHGPAVVVRETGGEVVATFQPCGCRLKVITPPILDDIPPGTRCGAAAWDYVPAEIQLQEMRDHFLEHLRENLIHSRRELGVPHVIKLMALTEAKEMLGERAAPQWRDPSDQVMVAIWLQAIPSATTHIVLRPAPDLDEDFLPPRMDGEWIERSVIYTGPQIDLYGPAAVASARPTGRVELREDGAAAEVYEVGPY